MAPNPGRGFFQSQIKNPTRSLAPLDKDTTTVIVKNEILAADVTTGLVAPATALSTRAAIQGVSNEDISAADALAQVLAYEIFENDTWVGDTVNDTDPAHNYQRMVLSDSKTANNTGTDNAAGVVMQVEPVGAATDKKALFKFV